MPLQLFPLTGSSLLTHYGFERGPGGRGALTVTFRGGGTWRYLGVPETMLEGLLLADSRGGYFRRHVVGKFDCERVGDG